jgi:hypothetical protein
MLRKEEKDLDSWINKRVKVLLNAEGYYDGILLSEKRIYIPYESVLSLEEI